MTGRPPDDRSLAEPALARALSDASGPAVLATIVAVEGSAYRRPGGKLLLTAEGETVGTLTAGCLRDRIVETGLAVLEDGSPRLTDFDLADDDTWDLATGCDGRIDVLFEPIDAQIRDAFSTVADRRPVTIVTAVESSDPAVAVGDRLVRSGGESTGSLSAGAVPSVPDGAATRTETVETTGGTVTVLVDPIEPPPRLLVFGSRPDLRPVAWLGRAIGFEVLVASPRGGSATAEAFPSANEVVACHPTDLPEYVDAWTYPVVLSHNAVDDRLAVDALLTDSTASYVGLLGSRDRTERLLDAIEADGTDLTDAQLDRLSAPVGLDVGGDGPTAVALSVVSEIHAVHHDRAGGRLSERSGPIHDRP